MSHYLANFEDNCYELTVLRWFRDNFVSEEDIKHYYKTAPMMLKQLNKKNIKTLYTIIYTIIL